MNKLMANSEDIRLVLRPSWAYFTGVYLVGLIVLILGIMAESWIVIVLALLVTPLVVFLVRLSHEFTITTHRIIVRNGLIARNTQELALHHIRAINVRQSIFNRILGIGHIEITSSADERGTITIEGVSSPVSIKEQIWSSMIEKTT
jgi:uncharacterized membrane protein YdbT with pleckstrin-like domain